MRLNTEFEIPPQENFYGVFFGHNNKERDIIKAEKRLDKIISSWTVTTFLMPLLGFYFSGLVIFMLTLTSLALLIITGNIMPKILKRKKSNLSKDESLIKLLYSEQFHKALFPYLNTLVEKYPEHFTYEMEISGKVTIINKTTNLKNLLISDYSPENFYKIKNELESIDNLITRIEKTQALYQYEKSIGVEVQLKSLINETQEHLLEHELVKML